MQATQQLFWLRSSLTVRGHYLLQIYMLINRVFHHCTEFNLPTNIGIMCYTAYRRLITITDLSNLTDTVMNAETTRILFMYLAQ